MTDIRQRLTALLLERIDWRDDDLADAVDVLLAEFLVVPRSEVEVEYGVQYGVIVHGRVADPIVARRRAVEVFNMPQDAARQREVWTGPWKPLDENGKAEAAHERNQA
ncbi:MULTISPECIES: hypothetical protein [Nocardia]|uniref:hypothetical protein n=1 Tax=Nocardia TaxID=1817 RepID=UPI00245730A6|nr:MULTISPECIES: hypothetical protein [Nocardia]